VRRNSLFGTVIMVMAVVRVVNMAMLVHLQCPDARGLVFVMTAWQAAGGKKAKNCCPEPEIATNPGHGRVVPELGAGFAWFCRA